MNLNYNKNVNKIMKVVCAVIIKNDNVLCCKRVKGKFKNYFEFPGGKVEINEDNISALIREVKEELGINVKVKNLIDVISHSYEDIDVDLYFYRCELIDEEPQFIEYEVMKWLNILDLDSKLFLPGNKEIIEKLKRNQ